MVRRSNSLGVSPTGWPRTDASRAPRRRRFRPGGPAPAAHRRSLIVPAARVRPPDRAPTRAAAPPTGSELGPGPRHGVDGRGSSRPPHEIGRRDVVNARLAEPFNGRTSVASIPSGPFPTQSAPCAAFVQRRGHGFGDSSSFQPAMRPTTGTGRPTAAADGDTGRRAGGRSWAGDRPRPIPAKGTLEHGCRNSVRGPDDRDSRVTLLSATSATAVKVWSVRDCGRRGPLRIKRLGVPIPPETGHLPER